MRKKYGTLEQYKELGKLAKETRKKLFEMHKIAAEVLPKEQFEYLTKTIDYLDKFRSKAEERMLHDGHFPFKTGMEFTKVFYGESEE